MDRESFQSAVEDLNIINLAQECYDLAIHFKNGSPLYIKNRHIDFFLDKEIEICFEPDGYNEILIIKFWIKDSVYDEKSGCAIINADKLKVQYDEDYEEVLVEKAKKLIPDYLAVKKVREKNLHYAV